MNPRIRLSHLPTPIEPLSKISQQLGGPNIFVKRDDLTGIAFGGNKLRKLEFVLAEALANGAKTLITVGAAQSNHCRQTAAVAAKFGLDCILILSTENPGILEANSQLDSMFGAEIVWATREEREGRAAEIFNQAWSTGRRPFMIPLGASTPTGTLGYLEAFKELQQQEFTPDWIVVASSSGGTQAGLALGACLMGSEIKVLGISIDHPAAELKVIVATLASVASELVGEKLIVTPEVILVNSDYLGQGYGVPSDREIDAIRLFARLEGVLLDPVYTARAAAGMIDLIQKGVLKKGEQVLFWHTGGTPALFAEQYKRYFV